MSPRRLPELPDPIDTFGLVTPEPLNDRNWLIVAMKAYDNPQAHTTSEFYDDMRHIKYVKKLVTQFEKTGDLKERLILNHLILLSNVLTPAVMVRIMFLKMPDHLHVMKPFFVMMGVLPEVVAGIGREGRVYHTDDIPMCPRVVAALRATRC